MFFSTAQGRFFKISIQQVSQNCEIYSEKYEVGCAQIPYFRSSKDYFDSGMDKADFGNRNPCYIDHNVENMLGL